MSVTQEELRSQFVTDQIVYKRAYDDVAIVQDLFLSAQTFDSATIADLAGAIASGLEAEIGNWIPLQEAYDQNPNT